MAAAMEENPRAIGEGLAHISLEGGTEVSYPYRSSLNSPPPNKVGKILHRLELLVAQGQSCLPVSLWQGGWARVRGTWESLLAHSPAWQPEIVLS